MKLGELRIVVDEREKKSGIPDLLRAVGLRMEIRTLPVGDYIVGPETVVERKSIRDLISSVFDGRLFDQCGRLREHFQHPVILVEGKVGKREIKKLAENKVQAADLDEFFGMVDKREIEKLAENPMSFYGALSTVALDFKIPIIPTPDAYHTAKLLVLMCSKRESARGPFIKKIRKSPDLQRQQLSLLASLPGVGEKLAVRMLERFGTPRGAMTSTAAELAKVKGLGGERARKIRKMLDSKSRHRKASDQKTLHDS